MHTNFSASVRVFEEAVNILKSDSIQDRKNENTPGMYLKTIQQAGETLDQYLQALHGLTYDSKFEVVDAQVYKKESIWDANISGLSYSTDTSWKQRPPS